MKKLILIPFFLCLMIGLIGCSKGKNGITQNDDIETNEGTESIQEENNSVQEKNNSVQKEDDNIQEEKHNVGEENNNIQEENTTGQAEDANTQQEQDTTSSVSSSYLPVNGTYSNGSDGDFHYIQISAIDQSSFSFSIYEGMSSQLVFKQHTAVFEEQDATTAVYRGEGYTLYFDCSEYATITLTGFEEVISSSWNTFWNSEVLQAS